MVYYIHQFADTAMQALKDTCPDAFYSKNSDFDIVRHNRKWNRVEASEIREYSNKHLKERAYRKRVNNYAEFMAKMATQKDRWLYVE